MARGRGASLSELQSLYERRLPQFRRVAAAVLGRRGLAEDVVQDAFVRAVVARESFEGVGSLEAWVWRIVLNAARDARARSSRVVEASPDVEVAADSIQERRELVRAAVEQLPERQRLILFLRYYADLDYRAIAAALSISDGTVAATLNAAHTRLRQLLMEVAL